MGLADKAVSERHFYASQRKMTAGAAAKKMTETTGRKILAKDVKELYKALYGRQAEWHHSGFYRGNNGRTMGRTFFISDEELAELIGHYDEITARQQEQAAQEAQEQARRQATIVQGFYYTWQHDYGGRYGRKRTFKVLHVYSGSEAGAPDNFTPCPASIMDKVRAADGRKYYGWDEPRLGEFEN